MSTNDDIQLILIEQIIVLNPRSRNKRLFNTIVTNISHLGLKRPITVTPRPDGKYDLVCGQGRLEAYQALGATTIPAIIITATKEDRYLMSLVENIARRHTRRPNSSKKSAHSKLEATPLKRSAPKPTWTEHTCTRSRTCWSMGKSAS